MAFDQKRHDELAKRDAVDLSEAEATELALLRSEVSLAEYDPSTLTNEADRVVEDPDRHSTTLGELAADESQPVSLRIDAQTAVDNPPANSPVFHAEQAKNVQDMAPGGPLDATKPEPAKPDTAKS